MRHGELPMQGHTVAICLWTYNALWGSKEIKLEVSPAAFGHSVTVD